MTDAEFYEMDKNLPHLVWKEQDGSPIEYFYGVAWEVTAFWMDDLKGSPTKEEAIEAFKARRDRRHEEMMEDLWTDI